MAKKKSFLDIEDVIEPFWRRTSISFAAKNPELVDEWCYERNCGWRPDDFTYASTVKAWWSCPHCSLQYKQVIHQRSWGHGCPYCASQKVSDDNIISNKSRQMDPARVAGNRSALEKLSEALVLKIDCEMSCGNRDTTRVFPLEWTETLLEYSSE